MSKILVEENNLYELDCTAALWATDQIHEEYHRAKTNLKDADFLIETEEQMLLVEYKNSNVPNAANPGAFDPEKRQTMWYRNSMIPCTTSICWEKVNQSATFGYWNQKKAT